MKSGAAAKAVDELRDEETRQRGRDLGAIRGEQKRDGVGQQLEEGLEGLRLAEHGQVAIGHRREKVLDPVPQRGLRHVGQGGVEEMDQAGDLSLVHVAVRRLCAIFGMLGAVVGNAIARGFGVEETAGIDWSRHIFQLVAAGGSYAALWESWESGAGERAPV